MSYHAYLKKLQSGIDKYSIRYKKSHCLSLTKFRLKRGKYLNLENLNCKIRPGCADHPAWPKGICNKCQPPTIYLNRQPYRHVDNIMFENSQIVENFLNYWRKSGNQRIGLLFGRYEAYDGVPLGIKAVVTAIYEPPQVCLYYNFFHNEML
jgi:nuclear protein localization family protein 4